jgi:prevent-host-death family protein
MKSVGLREIDQAFSLYMKIVKAGGDVLIAERGCPIAVIKPVAPETDTATKILHLEADGLLCPPCKEGRPKNHLPVSLLGQSPP